MGPSRVPLAIYVLRKCILQGALEPDLPVLLIFSVEVFSVLQEVRAECDFPFPKVLS